MNYLKLCLLLFFINCNAAFAQDFQIDSLLLKKTTIAKNDSVVDISVTRKVFVTTKYVSNEMSNGGQYEGYLIKSEYWIYWNNKSDSMKLSISHPASENNFRIYFRKLQNKINAVILEYSEITNSSMISPSTKRFFQIINMDTKSLLFYRGEQDYITTSNGGTHGNYRHDIDTYTQQYSLTFDENDNVIFSHIHSSFQHGMGAFEERKTRPKQVFSLVNEKNRWIYKLNFN